ncbi:alpha/beta fold hydrolase [Cylindrospermopsis raciborskii]|uniref:alpha/beta fold hydrolase n=1 Tax=Cylindrospermopsis raciborskii TaxID=77022 RepID=UPI0038D0BF5B
MIDVELKLRFLTPKPLQPEYPLFIYLPGMDGTGEMLQSQISDLGRGFDIRCLAIPKTDMRDWNLLTTNVLDLIDMELTTGSFKRGNRLVYLCGESFGACLAMKIAIQSPSLFKRIILINPASSFKLNPWISFSSQMTNLVPSWFYPVGAWGLLPFLASLPRISSPLRRQLLQSMTSLPAETINWRLSLLRHFHLDHEKMQQLKQETLLIAGGSDRLLPSLTEVERLGRMLPNSKIVILPDSGHACLVEEEINLYKILQDQGFYEKVSLNRKF